MADKSKNFVFHADTYEERNNVNKKLLTTDDVSGGNNIEVDVSNDGKSISVGSTLPFSVQNGMLMVTYQVETEDEVNNNEEVEQTYGY